MILKKIYSLYPLFSGRILNIFSKDIGQLDDQLPNKFTSFYSVRIINPSYIYIYIYIYIIYYILYI